MREVVPNLAPWGQRMRYARAIRVGNLIEVSGTTAVDAEGSVVCVGNIEGQVRACLKIIRKSIEDLGGTVEDTVRTRIFVTDVATWRIVGAVHDELLGHVAPTSSLVGIHALLHPDLLVEIEATAIVGSAAGDAARSETPQEQA